MPPELASTFLYEVRATLAAPHMVGATPEGMRAIFDITGGIFEGPRLHGRVLPSGADWGCFRADGSLAVDVRMLLVTGDAALIYVSYRGRLVVPIEDQAAVFDMAAETRPGRDRYSFRTAPMFETAAPRYAWLNGIVAIGVGEVVQGGVTYRVHQID